MNKHYQAKKSLLRASFAADTTVEPRFERVDREGKVLNGVQITLTGEALGHDVWLDKSFCEDVAAQGNQAGEAGVKVRFGHPSMCSDALGTYLGRAKNFRCAPVTRKNGEVATGVFADVYLDPNADRTEWVMNMAETAPDTFGQSIVFTYADTKYIDADGNWHLMSEDGADIEKSADGKEYAILGRLHGTDFTDTPAATDGVFSADSFAAEADNLLAEHPDLFKIPAKNVIEFCKRAGLTNVIEAFENGRVSSLQKSQAAKENEWQASMAALAAERDAAKAEIEKLGQEIINLKAMCEKLEADLNPVKAELDAALNAKKEVETALAEKSAALKASEERYASQIAPALTVSANGDSWASKYRSVSGTCKRGKNK